MIEVVEDLSWWGIICRRRSVSSPLHSGGKSSVDYFSLCNKLPDASGLLGITKEAARGMHPVCKAALVVCISNGMRIGEVLSLRYRDRVAPGIYAAKALKGGRAFLVAVPFGTDEEDVATSYCADHKLFPVTYQQVYRAAVKAGARVQLAGRVNASVTHTGRYRIAQKLAAQGDLFKVSDVLRHKNPETKAYYTGRGHKKSP